MGTVWLSRCVARFALERAMSWRLMVDELLLRLQVECLRARLPPLMVTSRLPSSTAAAATATTAPTSTSLRKTTPTRKSAVSSHLAVSRRADSMLRGHE